MPDVEKLQRELALYKGLVEVSSLIAAITGFDELLRAILDVACRVMKAEAGSLFLLDAAGDLRLAIARGPAGELRKDDIVVPRGRGISGWVLEHNQPQLVADTYADPRFYADVDRKSGFRTRSLICVPLSRGGKRIGVLQALNPLEREAFDQTDMEAFSAYAELVATAMEKVRFLEQERERERVSRELALAHEIQDSFLPQHLPQLPSLTFAASYRAAANIGGDFYDVIPGDPGEIYFTIGDVSGKGIPAALLMAQALSLVRSIVTPGVSPAAVLTRWNEALCGRTIRGMFITAIIGRIVTASRTVELASAGHCFPMRLTGDGSADVPMQNALPLGIMPRHQSALTTLTLAPEEWLLFFTDGLTESHAVDDDLLDRAGVHRLLARHFATAAEITATLQHGEAEHRTGAAPHDDLTLLVFGFR